MFMQFNYWLPPASSGFLYVGQKMQLTGYENANNMRNANARAHKIQWSGPTVHFFTVVWTRCSSSQEKRLVVF